MLMPVIVALALSNVSPSPSSSERQEVASADEHDASTWQRGVLAVLAPSDDGAPLYADGADCAIRLCCASGFIAGRAIESCGILSNEGKAIAFVIAIASGVTGLALGAALAFAVYGAVVVPNASGPDPLHQSDIEVMTTIVFATGALFTLVGTVVGIGAALFIDHACILPGKALIGAVSGTRQRRFFFQSSADDVANPATDAPLASPEPKAAVSF